MSSITKASSELTEGDIVVTHGMRVRLGEVHSRMVGIGEHESEVFWSTGELLNRLDVPAERIPMSFTAERGEVWNVLTGRHIWTVQGNDLVRWTVEVDEADQTRTASGWKTGSFGR